MRKASTVQIGLELRKTVKHVTDVKHRDRGNPCKAILDLAVMIHGSNSQLVSQCNILVAHSGKGQLLDAPEAVSSWMLGSRVDEDLNSNQTTYFAHPLASQLLSEDPQTLPRRTFCEA